MPRDAEILTARSKWLAARRTGIGGSDAAAAAGLSPWTTRLALYFDKIGQASEIEENADMRRGTLLEPVVRQLYADATGDEVVQPGELIRHPTLPFALANLDGIVRGRDKLLECKTARNRAGWGEPGSADIPINYLCQVQHCMAVAELDRADVAVMFGTDFEFAIYEVPADAEFQSLLFEREAEFWQMVERRIPPDPQTASDVKLRWPRSRPSGIAGGEREASAAIILAAVRERRKEIEAIEERAEAILKLAIQENEALKIDGRIVATWKSSKDSEKFDLAAFKSAHPKLYKKFLKSAPGSRRFLLKEKEVQCLTNSTILSLPPWPNDLLPATGD